MPLPPVAAAQPRLAVALVLGLAALPGLANPADDAASHAQRGADHFKKGQYLDAAQAFERAWQLDPSDSKHLRYAGRAWQEVGHWFKARLLMERYLEIEKDPNLRASVVEKLEPLRKATPQEVAEALVGATERYPHGRLELEAAQALEDLGDERSLQRALGLIEVAKLAATNEGERDKVDAAARRVKARLADLQKTKDAGPAPTPEPPKVAPEPVPAPAPAEAPKPVVVQPQPAPVVAVREPAPVPTPAPEPAASWRKPVGWSCVGVGAVLAVLGVKQLLATADASADYDAKIAQKDAAGKVIGYGTDIDAPNRAQRAAEDVNTGGKIGGGLAGVGAALGVAGVVVLATQPADKAAAWRTGVGLGGVILAARF
jgi:tetratricopeptide (TPR) repeat protein